MMRNSPLWLRLLLKWGAMGLLIGLVYLLPALHQPLLKVIDLLSSMDITSIKIYLLSFGVWAPLVSSGLMVFQALVAPIPAFLITFANAMLFGWWQGALLSLGSALIGASLCFFIAKWCGRDLIIRFTSVQALADIDTFFARHGQKAVLIARLLPFISFDLVSYAAGLTSMSFWRFFLASAFGQIPATLIYSWAGGMLTDSSHYLMLGLLTLFALSLALFMLRPLFRRKSITTGESQS